MRPGQLVADRFEIERLAGKGGMAAVFRARDRLTSEVVALKLLYAQEGREAERFGVEARVLAELSHPNIVRYIAHGITPAGERYLAMEWLEGEDLFDRLARSGLTADEAVVLGLNVSEALGVAHAHGVVHRDITPGNLFLVDGAIENVKVLDFGIARMAGGLGVTNAGVVLGTLGYMSPEQARGQSQIDPRADVFALGCVLFECLAGRAPFLAGDNLAALLAKILLEEAPSLHALREDVPPELDALIARMLSKDPADRPADGAATAAEFAALGTTGGTERGPVSLRPAALTENEQRLVCVVMAGRPPRLPSDERSMTLNLDARRATLDQLRDAVEGFGGWVEFLMDGSIVATPKGAGAMTDQAAQAARCALAIRALLPEVPMGLATGHGLIGQAWPVGEVIEHAAKLLSAPIPLPPPARMRPIRLDRVSAGLLDERFDVDGDAHGLLLRGERAPVEGKRTLLGKPSPCVGRERELGTLGAFWDECVAEPVARAVLVTAPPGVGKSRLRYEFLRAVRQRGRPVEILLGYGDPISAGSPFGMLASALRSTVGLLDGEPVEVRRQKLVARLERQLVPREAARVAEFLGEMLGVPFPEDESVQLRAARQDAVLMGDQMRRAWEDFLAAECQAQPVMIVLEDLHWGDLPSVRFLDAALRTLADQPLMVVALARPELHDVFPGLWAERGAQEIRLGELTRKASEKLVRQVLGDGPNTDMVRRIVERAAGNAFYLEELIRAVAEGHGDALPETVLAMVQARLEGLEPEARRVLRAASVFGEVFWQSGVTTLLGGQKRTAQFGRWFDELSARELITRRGEAKFRGETEYQFRHALVRDAAHAMLTEADLALGHRLAAEWLERAGESDSMTLGEHFERGGQKERAAGYYRRAAEQALEGNDLSAAIERAQRGIACGATGAVLGHLKLLQAEALKWKGEFARAEQCAVEATETLARGSTQWFIAAGELAMTSGRLGHYDVLTGLADVLRGLGLSDHPSGAEVIAWERVTMHLLHAGRYDEAEALLARIGTIASQLARVDPLVSARVQQVRGHAALVAGDPAAALELIGRAASAFETAGDLRRACLQRASVGYISMEVGAYAQAETALREALAAAERMGLATVIADARHNLGLALARRGLVEEARRVEADALAAFQGRGDRRMEGGSRVYLATIHEIAGDLDAAEREARTAVEVLTTTPPIRAFALATLARIERARGDVAGALATAQAAAGLLEVLGKIETGESLVRLELAEALFAAGHSDDARRAIAVAQERLLLRAEKISDALLRQSFLERIPENAQTMARAYEWLGIARTTDHT